MKLLIADDEKLTREGLRDAFDWSALGIQQVFLADDGINALRIVREEHPDIILSDVRMPRMTGIDLASAVQEDSPDTSVIFMSGYSDKKYLKAAIRLKAVNYIEKPLNLEEVRAAILEAVKQRQSSLRHRQNEQLDYRQKSGQLAWLLTRPYIENEESILAVAGQLEQAADDYFTSYIINMDQEKVPLSAFDSAIARLQRSLSQRGLRMYATSLHSSYHILVITTKEQPTKRILSDIDRYISESLHDIAYYYAARGQQTHGISRAYQSYASAVVVLQTCFFFPGRTILAFTLPDEEHKKPYPELPFESTSEFEALLLEKDEPKTDQTLAHLYNFYNENLQALPSQAKGFYFRLLNCVDDVIQQLGLNTAGSSIPAIREEERLDELERCFSYDALHRMLVRNVNSYFHLLEAATPEDPAIHMIKSYVNKHYGSEDLSIKAISEYAHLSVSYMCTYFKNQTGLTLNQYITEYRMERAIQLLKDPRNQISDISARVGYSNGNYFSKSFKKYTGESPSKYRENNTAK